MPSGTKIHRVLAIFLLFFLAICLRIWYLGVIQKDEKLLESQKPQQRTILIRADRGIISDRFHIPLAINRISYNASIYYSQIAEIPTVAWEGKSKIYPRKKYIQTLSKALAKTLELDAERIEDLIHSKAALFPHVPFIIKSGLSEQEYYRLRMFEKDFPGIHAEISSTRSYPLGKTACNILGTMGAISPKEYSAIAQELSELQVISDLGLLESKRLIELKEKAYTINDFVGKTGIETQYEEELRGFFGKKIFEVDQKGRFVREISNKAPVAGKQIVLSISAELQQFAENLLIQDERTRDGRSIGFDPADKKRKVQKQPWIKGGAIVAMDPNTGEILAMASHPRFDPNDFIVAANSIFTEGKNRQMNRWLENEGFIASLWDGTDELIREGPKPQQEESQPLTWEFYLNSIFPKESSIRLFFDKLDIKGAILLQEDFEAKDYFLKAKLPVPAEIEKRLAKIPLDEKDLLFAVDLCRTLVYAPAFTDDLIERFAKMKLSQYRALCQSCMRKEALLKPKAKEAFHQNQFRSFRECHQKEFLAEMRKKEKEIHSYARPYIDYLDKKEKELFDEFWEEKKAELLATDDMPEALVRTFRSFSKLSRPLLGRYRKLKSYHSVQTEKEMAAAFYPIGGFGFSRSYAFEATAPPGSVFKLVTAYEALRQGKQLILVDELSSKGVAYTPNGMVYPRHYKGGRLPRSARSNIGRIDLTSAIEQTSNPYFAILAGDCFEDPENLAEAARLFGYGEKTGIEHPREKRGNVSSDLKTNRTGLYSAAIGQHTLLATPLQTAGMISSIANGGKKLKSRLIKEIIGTEPDRNPLKSFTGSSYFAKEELHSIGIHFPLFTSMQPQFEENAVTTPEIEVLRTLPMASKIRATLIEGMDRVVWGAKGSARPGAVKALLRNPILMREYLSLKSQMIGKTGTAEINCNLSTNPSAKAQMYKYIWFAAASFTDLAHKDPELAVVVFLRFGDGGKEAAPLAAQMIHKWREIKKKHGV